MFTTFGACCEITLNFTTTPLAVEGIRSSTWCLATFLAPKVSHLLKTQSLCPQLPGAHQTSPLMEALRSAAAVSDRQGLCVGEPRLRVCMYGMSQAQNKAPRLLQWRG